MTEDIFDEDLGRIIINRNVRAKNIIARHKGGAIQLTIPTHYSKLQIEKVLSEMKPRLLNFHPKPKTVFNHESEFKTFSFKLQMSKQNLQNHYTALKDGVLSISYPENWDIESDNVQNIIRETIEKTMRYEAKRIFPNKVAELAQKHGFTFSEVKINKSRSRWGSCSYKKTINLSYFCMLLPEDLVNFVILHELCHTMEMNHGERFWAILDKVSDGKAKHMTIRLKTEAQAW